MGSLTAWIGATLSRFNSIGRLKERAHNHSSCWYAHVCKYDMRRGVSAVPWTQTNRAVHLPAGRHTRPRILICRQTTKPLLLSAWNTLSQNQCSLIDCRSAGSDPSERFFWAMQISTISIDCDFRFWLTQSNKRSWMTLTPTKSVE